MTILFLDAYHDPEVTADTHLENDLIEALVSKKIKVLVICPTPTRGIDEETYHQYKTARHEISANGLVETFRFIAPREHRNPIGRALRYFWCHFASLKMAKKVGQFDAIYCVSTPPTQGLLARRIKAWNWKKNKKISKITYYLEDIFPDTLVSSGISSQNSLFYKLGRLIEKKTYSSVDNIVVLSEMAKDNLLEKDVPSEKIQIVPSWIDLSSIKSIDKQANFLFDQYGINREFFIVLYAGNLGESQNVEMLIDVAKQMSHFSTICFIIVGSGGNELVLKQKSKDLKCDNIVFIPLQKLELASYVYSLGDVDLIMCKKGFGSSALPSKTWTIMAASKPIIGSYDIESDFAKIILDSNSGLLVDAGNEKELIRAIEEMYYLPKKELEQFGKNGRCYVEENRDKCMCVEKLIGIIIKE